MEKQKNYRIYFINYKKRGDHVEYIMRLNCIEDSRIFAEFAERFSSLKDFHDIMKKEANSTNFPKFPPKKFFGNTDEKFLNKRQTDLQHYFNDILGSKEFSLLPSVKSWILRMLEKHAVPIRIEEPQKSIAENTVSKPIVEQRLAKNTVYIKPREEGK
jgi:hypothetical protein